MAGAVAGAIVAAALTLLPFIAMAAQADDDAAGSAGDSARVEALRQQATDTLLKGQYDSARREFEEVLRLRPGDGPAERDAARAAAAAGQFEYAVAALERAHHFEQHKPDPELHYLRGEALYVLGRDEEAHREHHIAELEIGLAPAGRMEKLWLARIYARRGYVVLADRVYEPMLPPAPKFDTEVALNQADAHLINQDWAGGARLLRRYLTLDPSNVRARSRCGGRRSGRRAPATRARRARRRDRRRPPAPTPASRGRARWRGRASGSGGAGARRRPSPG